MTHPILHRSAHAATAVLAMATFARIFFGLSVLGLIVVTLVCVLMLAAMLQMALSTRRTIHAAIDDVPAARLHVVVGHSPRAIATRIWGLGATRVTPF